MRTGNLHLPTNTAAYATPVANAAAVTASIDDSALGDGSQGSALDTGTIYTLSKTSTAPYGPQVLATLSGTGRWLTNAVGSFPGLPAPRVRQLTPGTMVAGVTRNGTAIDCFGSIRVSIDGLPDVLRTNTLFKCQIELGRYIGSRHKPKLGGGYIYMPQGFYHPSPWVGGVTPPGSGGTRGGAQNLPAAVDRPSEWPIAGLAVGGGITLPVAAVFAPWCQFMDVKDLVGGSVTTVSFRTKTRRNARPPGFYPNTPRGVFAFRYAYFDTVAQRWVSGPWSENVFVRPKGWPLARNPPGTYPALDTVLPDRVQFRQLVCTVGGRVR
jgi:hypothetical protein